MRELRDDSLIDMKFILEDTGFTEQYIYQLIRRGDYARPLKFGRASRWYYADHKHWKESRPRMKKAS